jgi:hypothetical protein
VHSWEFWYFLSEWEACFCVCVRTFSFFLQRDSLRRCPLQRKVSFFLDQSVDAGETERIVFMTLEDKFPSKWNRVYCFASVILLAQYDTHASHMFDFWCVSVPKATAQWVVHFVCNPIKLTGITFYRIYFWQCVCALVRSYVAAFVPTAVCPSVIRARLMHYHRE